MKLKICFKVSQWILQYIFVFIILINLAKLFYIRNDVNKANKEKIDSILNIEETVRIASQSKLRESQHKTISDKFSLTSVNQDSNRAFHDSNTFRLIDVDSTVKTSFYKATNYLEFNFTVNRLKRWMFFHLIFACIIFNLMLISYLMRKTSSLNTRYPKFFRFHFCVNLTILVDTIMK